MYRLTQTYLLILQQILWTQQFQLMRKLKLLVNSKGREICLEQLKPLLIPLDKSLKFRSVYDDYKQDLIDKMSILTSRFQEIRHLQGLQKMLLITLNIGNFLNAKTPRGKALGFKIEALDICAEIKTSDNQNNNLLLYIIEKTEQIIGSEIISEDKMKTFEVLQRVPVHQLVVDLGDIKKGCSFIKKAMESQTDDPQDLVQQKFKDGYDSITKDIEELDKKINLLEEEYKTCAQFYGENPKDPSDKFGDKILKIFRQILRQKLEKLQREERAKRQEALKKRQMLKSKVQTYLHVSILHQQQEEQMKDLNHLQRKHKDNQSQNQLFRDNPSKILQSLKCLEIKDPKRVLQPTKQASYVI